MGVFGERKNGIYHVMGLSGLKCSQVSNKLLQVETSFAYLSSVRASKQVADDVDETSRP